jgi:hypothetical protein
MIRLTLIVLLVAAGVGPLAVRANAQSPTLLCSRPEEDERDWRRLIVYRDRLTLLQGRAERLRT